MKNIPKLKLHIVGGARPNFIKIAPLIRLLDKDKYFLTKFINTGQHYNSKLYDKILVDLKLRSPDINLNVGSFSGNTQISKIMYRYEKYLKENTPDMVIVFGDVNSTLASALTAKKMGIKLAHIEAGLRCYDDDLPEEVNRRLTDSVSDYFFTPSPNEKINLKKENITKNIFFVGNIMIDSLKIILNENKKIEDRFVKNYGLITLHRPENVDNLEQFSRIIDKLEEISKKINLIFPIHPRTKKSLRKFNLIKKIRSIKNIKITNSFGYIEFLRHVKHSEFVISDSGGVQEETSILGIPCFTLRKNTERPITITKGNNQLVNLKNIISKVNLRKKKKIIIAKWDGKTAERIVKVLKSISI